MRSMGEVDGKGKREEKEKIKRKYASQGKTTPIKVADTSRQRPETRMIRNR